MKKILLLIFVATISLTFAQKKPFEIEDLYKVKTVGAPVLSNDGSKIVFTLSHSDLKKSKSYTDLYIMNSDGTDLTRFTSDPGSEYNPIWNNEDNGIYFVSYKTGSAQLYFKSLDQDSAKSVTDIQLPMGSPKISPDGKSIIFTAKVFPECGADADCNKKINDAMANGPIHAHISDSLFVRHWTEYIDGKYSHVFHYDFDTKKITDLTPGYYNSPAFSPGGSDDYNFSPDSKEVVFTSKRVKNPEQSTNNDIYVINTDGSGLKNITPKNKGTDGHPVYSPDGKYIAYLTQTTPGYESDRIRLAIHNRETGQNKIITDPIDNMVGNFEWSDDSKHIYFTVSEKGYTPLFKINIETERFEKVFEKHSIRSFTIFPDESRVIFNYTFCHKPTEIAYYKFNASNPRDLTSFNRDFTRTVDVRPAEQHWVKGANGKMVHVFLVKPHNFDPAKKYPLVINVHGGPQMQWQDNFRGDWQVYPGAGYVLAYPNPHGSTGYGQEYTLGISKDWDGKVYEDVIAVTDYLAQLPYVDENRMGAMGWSYGGYFMNLLQAKKATQFKCLASMMGIYDLEPFYLETEELWFPQWDIGKDPWSDREAYQRMSPSSYVHNFSIPTLIITGKKDYRVSYTQSLRYFTALQKKNVPSRFIVFDNDGHWPSGLKSMPLYYNAHLEWFHKYLGGKPAPWDSKKMVRNLHFED